MGNRICSVENCGNSHKGHGYCGRHYQRFVKYGSVELPERLRPTCSGPACDRTLDPIQNRSGLCLSHYKQQSQGKPLTPLRIATKDLGRPSHCQVENCGRPHKARGYCKTHDLQVRSGGSPKDIKVYSLNTECLIGSCTTLPIANGYCAKHNYSLVSRWAFYGMTLAEARGMYESQAQACAICSTPSNLECLVVDHDHSCCRRGSCGACVRGLLCSSCNLGLGNFRDDSTRLKSAIRYLSI